jgi:hypothetical protein
MFASVLIIVVSLVLMAYWFRYSCLLVVRNLKEQRQAAPVDDPRFAFSKVQADLETAPSQALLSGSLDPLHRSLDRDFQFLQYLVEHAAGLRLDSVDDRLLMIDYKVMRWWYRFTLLAAPEQARRALAEQATVLGILVNRLRERAGVTAEV